MTLHPKLELNILPPRYGGIQNFALAKQASSQELEDDAVSDKLLSWLDTELKALETAGCKEPLLRPNVRATRIDTKAMMAPYSVIPCPFSSRLQSASNLASGFFA